MIFCAFLSCEVTSHRCHPVCFLSCVPPSLQRIPELRPSIHQFILMSSAPEKEVEFVKLREEYGSFFAFHGEFCSLSSFCFAATVAMNVTPFHHLPPRWWVSREPFREFPEYHEEWIAECLCVITGPLSDVVDVKSGTVCSGLCCCHVYFGAGTIVHSWDQPTIAWGGLRKRNLSCSTQQYFITLRTYLNHGTRELKPRS